MGRHTARAESCSCAYSDEDQDELSEEVRSRESRDEAGVFGKDPSREDSRSESERKRENEGRTAESR